MIRLISREKYQNAFVTPSIIIIIGILLIVGAVTVAYKNMKTDKSTSSGNQEARFSTNPSPTVSTIKTSPSPITQKTLMPTPKLTATPTQAQSKPTPTPTSTPSPTSAPTSTPTPTPKPKPACNVLILPSSSGTAPYEASVCVGNTSSPSQNIQQEFADYDGNGSWDYQGPQYGCHAYTFQNPGTYSPKAKIIGSSGEESDVCQTTVTIN